MKNVKVKQKWNINQINISRINASNQRFEFDKINKITVVIHGRITNHVINTYLKMKTLMGVRRFFLNIANNNDFIDSFCNDEKKTKFIIFIVIGIYII